MTYQRTLNYLTTQHGETFALLPEGTRIRSKSHPHLTGVIKHYEWHVETNTISPIPYCIGWDDSDRACAELGWFFVYSGPGGIEPTDG